MVPSFPERLASLTVESSSPRAATLSRSRWSRRLVSYRVALAPSHSQMKEAMFASVMETFTVIDDVESWAASTGVGSI